MALSDFVGLTAVILIVTFSGSALAYSVIKELDAKKRARRMMKQP